MHAIAAGTDLQPPVTSFMSFPLSSVPSASPLASAKAFHHRGVTSASPVMRRLFSMLEQVERTRDSVLLGGEPGVGKERIARAIADARGSGAPFVVLDGSAPEEDGLVSTIAAAFACALGGTLLVRDVDRLPCPAQEALLRLVPLHAGRVRVVSTTTRSLEDQVRQGAFLEELYDELAAVRLFVPPLRHRPEDVVVLARVFADELGAPPLPAATIAELSSRAWTGNVTELRRTVTELLTQRGARESGVVPSSPDSGPRLATELEADLERALAELVDVNVPYAELKEQVCLRFAKVYLTVLIAHTGGNRTEAARIAGLDRTYLGRQLVRLGVPVPASDKAR